MRTIFQISIECAGLPWSLSGKEPARQCKRHRRFGFDPWVGKIPYSRKWQPTPVFLPGKFCGQRSLVGYSPWGHTESDLILPLNNNNWICYNIAGFSLYIFCFFDSQAYGIWAPRPGIKPAPQALKGEVSTTRPPGMSQPPVVKLGEVCFSPG